MSYMVNGMSDANEAPPSKPDITRQAKDVINDKTANTCSALLNFPWFTGEAIVPVVESILKVLKNPFSPTRQKKEAPGAPPPYGEKDYRPFNFSNLRERQTDPAEAAAAQRFGSQKRPPPMQQKFRHHRSTGQKRKEPDSDEDSSSHVACHKKLAVRESVAAPSPASGSARFSGSRVLRPARFFTRPDLSLEDNSQ